MFRSQSVPLEQLLSELGEVLEEEERLVPNYLTMNPDVAFLRYEKAPGDLCYPETVTIDSNNRISVFLREE